MHRPLAAAAVVLACSSLQAEAKVYLSLTNQTNETFILYSTDVAPVILTDAGATFGKFKLPAARRVIITFTAECKTFSNGSPASIQILIDNVAVKPTSLGDGVSFCSFDSYGTHSITVTKALAAGTHKIRIDGRPFSSTSVYFRKSSLVVFD